MQPNDFGGKGWAARRQMLAVFVVIVAAGCASMAARMPEDYDRGSASAQKFGKDSDSCVKQAEAHQKEHGYGPYDPTHGSYNYMYDLCMRSSGYQRRTP
jgi:hypothetical protein